jgi:DNA polymerase III alpha subunit (gram-positive type)
VKEWDDNVTKPMIRRFYAWMMQFSEKPEIKGDMTIKARGTSALLVKEVQNQQVMALIQNFSQNPTLAPAFDWYEALKVLNASMSLGSTGILKEKEQYDQAIQQAQQAAQQGGDPRLEMQMQIQQMKQEHELRLQQMKAEQANQIEQMNSQQKAMMLQVQFESNASRERIEVMKLQQTKQISEEQMLMRLNEIDKNHRHDMAQFMAEIQLKQQDGLTANYGLGNE